MSVLARIRKQLMSCTSSTEQELLSQGEGIQGMFDQIQTIRLEMNEAKKAAAAEAAQPYLDAIEKIEIRYALYLKLKSN